MVKKETKIEVGLYTTVIVLGTIVSNVMVYGWLKVLNVLH